MRRVTFIFKSQKSNSISINFVLSLKLKDFPSEKLWNRWTDDWCVCVEEHKDSRQRQRRRRRTLARGMFRKKTINIPRTPRTNERDFWVTIFQHTSHSHYHHHALHLPDWNSSSNFVPALGSQLCHDSFIRSSSSLISTRLPSFAVHDQCDLSSHIFPRSSLTLLLFNWSPSLSVIRNALTMLCSVHLPAKPTSSTWTTDFSSRALRVLIKFVLFDFFVSFVRLCLFAEFAPLSFFGAKLIPPHIFQVLVLSHALRT